MKRLYLLRHAKSSWDDPMLADFDRPLSERGRRAAPYMGRYMRELGWVPGLALCSPARRARETWDHAVAELGQDVAEELHRGLYHAEPDWLLKLVHTRDGGPESLILIGHNPGFAMLATALAIDEETAMRIGKFPTAALAVFDLEIDSWSDAAPGRGRLAAFIRPRDLGIF